MAGLDDELMKAAEEDAQIEKSKKEMSHLEGILAAPETIDSLCTDILKHYKENRQYELTGKAMIVAYSRPIAISIYHRLLELCPDWTEKVKVVMTGGNHDPEEWHELVEKIKVGQNRLNLPGSGYLVEFDRKYRDDEQVAFSQSGMPFRIHDPENFRR